MSGKGTSTIRRPEVPPRPSDRGRSRLGDVTRPVRVDRRITKRRRSNVLLALLALAIAGALATALFVLPVRTYFSQDDQTGELGDELAQLEAVNADLRSEVDRLKTDEGVREAAREELGYVEEGEVRASVLDLPDVPTDLPDGWPYTVVTGIVALRTNPPVVASSSPVPSSSDADGAVTSAVTSAASSVAQTVAPTDGVDAEPVAPASSTPPSAP